MDEVYAWYQQIVNCIVFTGIDFYRHQIIASLIVLNSR